MEERVSKKLISLGIKKADKVGAAVSGGGDSMALLHCLCNLRQEMNIIIIVYHMEHGIRGESSAQDMAFVIKECEKRNVPCVVERADIPALAAKEGISIEAAARMARYQFLDSQDADYIATAHHMDDMAETVVMNLTRGSGLAGLCGIPEARGRYIRPLLDFSKQEIEEYLRQHNITYVQDETNDDISYTRNFIRKEILPRMKEINGSASANIARTAKLLAEDEEALMDIAQKANCIDLALDGAYIDLKKLSEQKTAIKKRIIRLAISQKFGLTDIENVHVQSVMELAQKAKTAKRVDLGDGVYAAVVYDKLMIGKNKLKRYNCNLVTLSAGDMLWFEDTFFECKAYQGTPVFAQGIEYFDAAVIKGAKLRHRREGDRIAPLGLCGTKRLSDYLSDRKIPLHQRDALILLAAGSEVFWVVGIGVSEKSKVKEKSTVVQIKYLEKQACITT
ncbi:MAG: tRNA lysidine(34) synthetase TilS [Christensenellales bacterium]|jgi:tRNA(Ile)-lysidine synthase